MLKFIVKRALLVIPIMFAVSFIVFAILRIGPVDPAMAYLLNSRLPPTAENLAATRADLGLDKPFFTQYALWLTRAAHGDFGRSYTTGRDAFADLLYYFPATLRLAGVSMIALILLSVSLGMAAALNRGRLPDRLITFLSFLGVSVPNFWLGFVLIYCFSVRLKVLPAFGDAGALSYIMPTITLSFMSIAVNTRLARASFLEHIGARSVFFLKVSGMSPLRIIGKYTLKESFLPIITSLGMHLSELLGGAVVVESLFAWPGVGRYTVSAINNHDFPVIQCFMLVMTAIIIIVNLVTDILYAFLNPKIVYGSKYGGEP
jgi:nickel transport system permease protein